MKKKLVALLMTAVMVTVSFTGCKSGDEKKAEKLVVAYQSSIAYAPQVIMQDQGLIEKHYGKELEVDWQLLANGSAINEGIAAGKIDVGSLGLAPAITAMQAGTPYKIFGGISSQPYGIQTNKEEIKTLKDIKKEDMIAITGINSQPHIMLAMAAKQELGDARALDGNLTVLANADGYTAIESGSVQCHMVISPYNFMETDKEGIHEIEVSKEIWPDGDTFIVGVASTKLKEERPELYDAVCAAMDEAMEYIAKNPEATAELLSKEYDASKEEILSWLQDEGSVYSTELQGVMKLANFMVEEGFLDNGPASLSDITFDNVKGN